MSLQIATFKTEKFSNYFVIIFLKGWVLKRFLKSIKQKKKN